MTEPLNIIQSPSYSEMKQRVVELSKVANLLIGLKTTVVDGDIEPSFEISDTDATINFPAINGTGLALEGYFIEGINGSSDYLDNSTITEFLATIGGNYSGNMSIECDVSYSIKTSGFTVNTSEYKPYDGIGDAQTKARIPIFVGGKRISIGGYFRETITSVNYGIVNQVNAQPVLSFMRIS